MKSFYATLILIGLYSCQSVDSTLIELPFEKDLIPEGIAINARSEKLYLNSLKHHKIVSIKIQRYFNNIHLDKVCSYIASYWGTIL